MLYKVIKYSLTLALILIYNAAADNTHYTFRHIKVEDGLSQSTITNIIQDKKGYMWFCTGNGLNKYDGYSFVIYSNVINDPTSISSNAVTSVYEDSKGTLWAGTVDGFLNRFNRENETFTRFNVVSDFKVDTEKDEEYFSFPLSYSRNSSSSLTTIAEDNNGNLWIGTWGKGIVKFNPASGHIEHFYKGKDFNSISHNKITDIFRSSDGTLWICTMGGGLNKLNFKGNELFFTTYKNETEPGSISDNYVTSVYEDKEKVLWISTYSNGLNRTAKRADENDNIKFINYKVIPGENSIASNSIMSVIQDREGYIWIATFGGGLDRLDPVKNEFLNFKKNKFDENSLADDDVLTMYEDRSGIIWIGTHLGRGISKLEKNKIKFNHIKNLPSESSLNDDVVWSIYKDNKYLWIGTYKGGLNRIDNKGNFSYYMANSREGYSISDNHIRSIVKDFNGDLWVGTYNGGLNRFSPGTGKSIIYKTNTSDINSIGANQVLSIVIAPDSIFWIGTFGGGLNYFKYTGSENIQFKKFLNDPNDPSSISNNKVYSVFQTRDGVIWAGAFDGGLNRLDIKTGKFKRYMKNPADPTSLSHNRVMAVYEDSRGMMWISTYGGGLNSFDRRTEKFKLYDRRHGLSSDVIYGVLEDNAGNLWISSDNGLFKYYVEMDRFVHFDLDDGIQSREFSGGAYFKSYDGQIFFGGINGINYFYPDSISENRNIPPVVVSSIKISGIPYKGETNELSLNYNENILAFEFAALDFTNPQDNQYEYMLEGLETEWQKSDARFRAANYTNLSPGTYYFKVKGSNNDEIWNTQSTVIKITIMPPFWQTWWFITAAVLIAGLTIYFLSTMRIKSLLAIEKLKTKLAADLHDNIGAGLTEISILSELAVNDLSNYPEQFSNKLKNISETARQLIDNMSDIVWVVNPKRDSLHDLIIRLKDAYADLLSGLGISMKTYNLEKIEDIKLPMEYKQNLFMILKEGINNSIKHSHCKKIILEANVRKNIIEIIIKDDGIGINENSIEYGNGLRNIQNRAAALGAKVKWRNRKDGGTSLSFIGSVSSRTNIKDFLNNLKEQN